MYLPVPNETALYYIISRFALFLDQWGKCKNRRITVHSNRANYFSYHIQLQADN